MAEENKQKLMSDWFKVDEDGSIFVYEKNGILKALVDNFKIIAAEKLNDYRFRKKMGEIIQDDDVGNLVKAKLYEEQRIRWGIYVLDSGVQHLPISGTANLIVGDNFVPRTGLIMSILRESLRANNGVIMSLTNATYAMFKKFAAKFGITDSGVEKITFVDWTLSRPASPAKERNYFVASSDITDFVIKVCAAIDSVRGKKSVAIFDFVTPAVLMFGVERVQQVLKHVIAKLKRAGITSYFIVNKKAHEEEHISMIAAVFDGEIIIDDEKLLVKKMNGTHVAETFYAKYYGNKLVFSDGIGKDELRLRRCDDPITVSIENFDMMGRLCNGDVIIVESSSVFDVWQLVQPISQNYQWQVYLLSKEQNISALSSENGANIYLIDWYSHRTSSVIGVETQGNVFRSSYDPANLVLAVKECIRKAEKENINSGYGFVYIDVATPMILDIGIKNAYAIIREILAYLEENAKVTIMLVLNKDMHSSMEVGVIEELGSTIILVSEEDGTLTIGLESSLLGLAQPKRFLLEVHPRLRLSVMKAGKVHDMAGGAEPGREKAIDVQALAKRLRARELSLKALEDELRYREALLKLKEEEFKVRIRMFQKEVKKHITEKKELALLRKNIEKEREKMRKEMEELKKMWESVKREGG